MRVVSFYDVQPIPRYDGVVWDHVLVYEGMTETGPWVQIDSLPLIPADTDPAHPRIRNLTTELATLNQGWYMLTFVDSSGDVQQPVVPLYDGPAETMPYLPQLTDIGAVMTARTKNSVGNYLGTFDQDTRPTDDQVRRLIEIATDDVTASIDTDIPLGAYRYVKAAIIWKTAMQIELSFYPEQVGATGSPYDRMERMYAASMQKLGAAVSREWSEAQSGDETYGANIAFGGFPASDDLMTRPM